MDRKDEDLLVITSRPDWSTNSDSRVYLCSCGNEALSIEFDDDPKWKEVCFCSMSLWKRDSYHVDWWDQLKTIWRIFRHGHSHSDSICLSERQFENLRKFFNEHEGNSDE